MRGRHAHPELSDAAEKALERQSDLEAKFSVQEFDSEGIKRLDMLFEVVLRKVGVAFHYIYNNRSPCLNVPWLCLIQLDETSDDVGAEPILYN